MLVVANFLNAGVVCQQVEVRFVQPDSYVGKRQIRWQRPKWFGRRGFYLGGSGKSWRRKIICHRWFANKTQIRLGRTRGQPRQARWLVAFSKECIRHRTKHNTVIKQFRGAE